MASSDINQTAYAEHLRGCADLAKEITARMDLRDDSARQACFATVIINAERHNIFMEPTPRDSRTPASGNGSVPGPAKLAEQASGKPKDYAAPVSPQNAGAVKNPTPEQAEAGAKLALRDGVKRACLLLNQAGYVPALSNIPKDGKLCTLDGYIKTETQLGKSFVDLDSEDLEALIKNLSLKLDVFKHNVKSLEDSAGF